MLLCILKIMIAIVLYSLHKGVSRCTQLWVKEHRPQPSFLRYACTTHIQTSALGCGTQTLTFIIQLPVDIKTLSPDNHCLLSLVTGCHHSSIQQMGQVHLEEHDPKPGGCLTKGSTTCGSLLGPQLAHVSPKMFGFTCFVHIISLGLDKLSTKGIKCFSGYFCLQKRYKCYYPTTKRYYLMLHFLRTPFFSYSMEAPVAIQRFYLFQPLVFQ